MNSSHIAAWFLVAVLLYGAPDPLPAQDLKTIDSFAVQTAPSEFRQGRSVGAPQVLEIPTQDMGTQSGPTFQTEELPSVSESDYGIDDPYENDFRTTDIPLGLPGPTPAIPSSQLSYLGVLYATAEQGPEGVKVLSVVQGSPADRAGFQGVNTPPEGQSDLLKAAIVVLAMSPAGPFAIPLVIAHDMYTNRYPPGDLIVAVDDQPVRDAQEFSEAMRGYQPGDTVAFSVIRAGKPLQITVQLEEEPV